MTGKKVVRRKQTPPLSGTKYEFRIEEGEVLRRVGFGSFEVIKTKRGIMFKTYTGFHIWTTPYAMGVDGKAQPKNLYAWLDNLIEFKEAVSGHEDESFGDSGQSKGDVLEALKILTEANLVMPVTAFVDEGRAQEAALSYMRWLKDMQDGLREAMSSPLPEEDVKADFEGAERYKLAEDVQDAISEGLEEVTSES